MQYPKSLLGVEVKIRKGKENFQWPWAAAAAVPAAAAATAATVTASCHSWLLEVLPNSVLAFILKAR